MNPESMAHQADSAEETRIGNEPKRRHNKRRRRNVLLWGSSVAGIALVTGVWLGYQGSIVKSELESVARLLPTFKQDLTANSPAAAADTARALEEHTAAARKAANDPIWVAAAALPVVGPNFEAATEVATAADDVARMGVTPLASAFQSLDWNKLAPTPEGINLRPLSDVKPQIVAAAYAIRTSAGRLHEIDTQPLLPQVAEQLIEARNELDAAHGSLDSAADFVNIAPPMLGADAPRHYLLLMQNNAEVRASGGIPGALALLTVDKGKLSLSNQSSAGKLGVFKPPIEVDAEQQQIYSSRLGRFMQDVNLTPDFPTSATIAQTMWTKRTGLKVDGVVSIDPVALAYVLEATGPVKLEDPEFEEIATGKLPRELSGRNVVRTLLSDAYSQIPEPSVQDTYFALVAKAIFASLADGDGRPRDLVSALTHGVEDGRIAVWSAKSSEQSTISSYPIGGSIAGSNNSPAQFGVYFNDGTAAKMDYYVKRTVQLLRECRVNGYAQVKVRVKSTNTAPKDAATSLPQYVTGASAFGIPAGSVQTNVVAYGPVQSNVETALVDGQKVAFASQRHGNRPVGTVTVRLAPGQSSTVDFVFDKIVQNAEPKLSVTPTVQARKDMILDTTAAACTPSK